MIFLAATLAIAQPSDATIRYDWASFYCQRETALCRLTHRAQIDGAVTVAELQRIERRVCPYGIRDTDRCGEENDRVVLCRQEIIGRNEGLIATAPTNWEVDAGISEANPTPACQLTELDP